MIVVKSKSLVTVQIPEADINDMLPQPQDHRASLLVWSDLTLDNVDQLKAAETADEIKQILANLFHLTDYQLDLKSTILMDLYYYTVKFAKDNDLIREKMSAFFSIVKRVHEVCIETPFGNLDHTFRYFKDILLCHSVHRPPYSIELFTAAEVQKISEYVINTYFCHFKLYKYVFTPMVRLDLTINYVGKPLTPPPEEEHVDDIEDKPDSEEAIDSAHLLPEKEESAARKELRAMIKQYLEEEIENLLVTFEDQLKNTEDTLNEKLENAVSTADGKKKVEKKPGKKK